MATEFSFDKIDKTRFKCFRFKNGAVYYGETELVESNGEIVDNLQSYSEEEIQKLNRVRHGSGVELYGKTEEQRLCKYEGEWDMGRKHGLGRLLYPDGSEYTGDFKEDERNGYGVLKWANGDIYQGEWNQGRMEGPGTFTQRKGKHTYKGTFLNNLFKTVKL